MYIYTFRRIHTFFVNKHIHKHIAFLVVKILNEDEEDQYEKNNIRISAWKNIIHTTKK